MKRVLVMLALVGFLATPALADLYTHTASGAAIPDPSGPRDDVIWDNIPNGYLDTSLSSSQLDTAYPFDSEVADDFELACCPPGQHWEVTDVHWWGGYWNQDPIVPNTTAFNIKFWGDTIEGLDHRPYGAPDGTLEGDVPLAEYNIPIENVTVTDIGSGIYAYSVDLPDAWLPECDTRYWISIQSVNLFPPQWGWSGASDNQQLSTARYGFPLLGTAYWADREHDMAYQLTGVCVPEPATMALFGLGALMVLRRRR